MKTRLAICAALLLAHIGLGALGKALNSEALMYIFGWSIYGPLAAFELFGLPVFQLKGWYLPDVTPLGLGLAVALWVAIYWGIADVLVRSLARQPRRA